MDSFAVIGGEGFLGGNMIEMLNTRYPNASIASLDVVERPQPSRKRSFYNANLTDYASLKSALQKAGPSTVFHTASPHPEAPLEVQQSVNVRGTHNVVRACQECGVKRLVYTSSAGVVFYGEDLKNVDERLPPALPLMDSYNLTKYKAEQIVLRANATKGLLTCAIRPAGIFGPGDRQGTPGFLNVLKNKQHNLQLGNNDQLFDWTYVDNVVHAHLLAADNMERTVDPEEISRPLPPIAHSYGRRELPTSIKRTKDANWSEGSQALAAEVEPLSDEQKEEYDWPLAVMRNRYDQFGGIAGSEKNDSADLRVAGQAFFITNGEPIGFWDYARAIWYAYGGEDGVAFPPRILPTAVAWVFGGLSEVFSWATGRPLTFSRYRVQLATAHKYHNIERARRVLGYEPIVGLEDGIQRTAEWFKRHPFTAS